MAEVLPFPELPQRGTPELADAEARRQALDIRHSFVVEAPAGSGKTGLLIQRFLKLLADPAVTSPEQVLAITFTKKATAEMRDRVLAHIEAAQQGTSAGDSEFDRYTRSLAQAVVARDCELGWALLDEPGRLRIRTIDSLCAEIAHLLPVLSGSGGRLAPTEQAGPLYREAARRTLLLLGGNDRTLHSAIREVLLHRDGNLANCESFIAEMLSLREQWGDLIWGMLPPGQRDASLTDAYLDAHVLPRLQAALDAAIGSALMELQREFPPDILEELVAVMAELTHGDVAEVNKSLHACIGRIQPPGATCADLELWKALAHALVAPSTKSWRKAIDARVLGFKPEPTVRMRLLHLVSRLEDREELCGLLHDLSEFPAAEYPAEQWKVAKALFRVLIRAMAELQVVFAEREQCDFAELSLLARNALTSSAGAEDLAEAAGSRLQHLLVDEMQDTSASQYQLLEVLTRSWDGHSQTVFLVGDPRQSIYLFRQARVERFLRTIATRQLGELPLEHLKLTSNFRSQQDLVETFNHQFAAVFPRYSDPLPYTEAHAVLPPSEFAAGVQWHATILPNAGKTVTPTAAEVVERQRRTDAQAVVTIVREWFGKPLPANRRRVRTGAGEQVAEPWRIAVLVRSRNHLDSIYAALRDAGIPVRAVSIDALHERQEILDLTALTRALLHPADRVAALAVLRAPWCGLSLAELRRLTGEDDHRLKDVSIARLLAERGPLFPPAARVRAERVLAVLDAAAARRGRLTLAQTVEKAWRSLGGDALLGSQELTNTTSYFALLSELESKDQSAVSADALDARLKEMFAVPGAIAPDTPHVELLTIHKAKGLEWDVVIVPGLERAPGRSPLRLLAWTALDDGGEDGADVLLAPIAARGEETEPLMKWLNRLHAKREAAEYKRLFYVACTRARQELHLFAAPMEGARGELKPGARTLLKAVWPAAQEHFEQPILPMLRRAVEHDEPLEIAASAGPAIAPAERPPEFIRMPLSFEPRARFSEAAASRLAYNALQGDTSAPGAFTRPEGSFAARAFGNAVHASLDLLSRRRADGSTAEELTSELHANEPRLTAMLRSYGLARGIVARLTREALAILQRALADRDGVWILSPHQDAASEFSITASSGRGAVSSIRADRVFRAGPAPHAAGDDFLWIVDYKTASHGTSGLDAFVQRQKESYAAQLQSYARTLGPVYGRTAGQVRVGLYFPAIPRLVWWNPEDVS